MGSGKLGFRSFDTGLPPNAAAQDGINEIAISLDGALSGELGGRRGILHRKSDWASSG